MPTYEYQCKKCGHTFEKFQSMNDLPLRRCPKCRSGVKRLIGAGAGLLFKGTGFYSTDYRSSGYKESAKKEASDSTVDKKQVDKPASDKKVNKKETTLTK